MLFEKKLEPMLSSSGPICLTTFSRNWTRVL